MSENKGGAPLGNTNGAKGKRWQNAINTALEKRCKSDGQKALVKIAEQLLLAADEGNVQALKEIGDRLDGKPAQALDIKVKDITHEEALDQLDDRD